jgi:hypothetical protein
MIEEWPFEAEVRKVVTLLAKGDYLAVERLSGGVRLSSAELAAAVSEYGRTVTLPPAGLEPALDVVEHSDERAWSVVAPLWTVEEGRSDLSLSLTICRDKGQRYRIEVDDLHVL